LREIFNETHMFKYVSLIETRYNCLSDWKGQIIRRVKYILAPLPQFLLMVPPNFYFLIFWPHPFIYAANSNRNLVMCTARDPFSSKIRKYSSLYRGNFKMYEEYFRIFGLKGSRTVHMTQFLLELTA
jgi:hypothetical protein